MHNRVLAGDYVECCCSEWQDGGLYGPGPKMGDVLKVVYPKWVNGQLWYYFKEFPNTLFLSEHFKKRALDMAFAEGVLEYITLKAKAK